MGQDTSCKISSQTGRGACIAEGLEMTDGGIEMCRQ
jgi:hypothetical protein